jgi:hypothetical protein
MLTTLRCGASSWQLHVRTGSCPRTADQIEGRLPQTTNKAGLTSMMRCAMLRGSTPIPVTQSYMACRPTSKRASWIGIDSSVRRNVSPDTSSQLPFCSDTRQPAKQVDERLAQSKLQCPRLGHCCAGVSKRCVRQRCPKTADVHRLPGSERERASRFVGQGGWRVYPSPGSGSRSPTLGAGCSNAGTAAVEAGLTLGIGWALMKATSQWCTLRLVSIK